MSAEAEVVAIWTTAQKSGSCNGCTERDNDVIEISLKRSSVRVCKRCAMRLRDELRTLLNQR